MIFILLISFLVARPEDQRLARIVVGCATLLIGRFEYQRSVHPLTFSKIPGRSSGLFENANQSGSAIMLGMILAYGVVPSRLEHFVDIQTDR